MITKITLEIQTDDDLCILELWKGDDEIVREDLFSTVSDFTIDLQNNTAISYFDNEKLTEKIQAAKLLLQ